MEQANTVVRRPILAITHTPPVAPQAHPVTDAERVDAHAVLAKKA